MRKRTFVMYGCVMALTLAMMTGCGTSIANASKNSGKVSKSTEASKDSEDASSGDSSSSDKKGKKEKSDGSKMVQVTKIDGNTITATVGEDMRGDGRKGKAPSRGDSDKSSGDKQTPSKGSSDKSSEDKQTPAEKGNDADSSASKEQPPEKPDGDSDSSAKSSGDKKGGPHGGMPFTATDETMTFTITSDTKITTGGRNSSTEAAASDIKENSILRVTVNENNEAESIVIMGEKK